MTSHPVLAAYGMTYRWNRSDSYEKRQHVLNDVSFEINKGDFVALLGPNGSGKSTLMKLASGVFALNQSGCSGHVRYLGQDFLSMPSWQRAQRVVYVPPEIRSDFPLTAEEAVFLGRTCQGKGLLQWASRDDKEKVKWAMSLCLCWDLRNRKIEHLSGGERQLVALARALAQGAKILFLDETLSRMDLNHQAEIGKMLKNLTREGWSILLVSHDLNLASEWADRCIFLKKGKIVFQGLLRETLTEENIKKVYPESQLFMGMNPITGAPKVFFGKNT